jgi:hypothetical protein
MKLKIELDLSPIAQFISHEYKEPVDLYIKKNIDGNIFYFGLDGFTMLSYLRNIVMNVRMPTQSKFMLSSSFVVAEYAEGVGRVIKSRYGTNDILGEIKYLPVDESEE